MESTVQPQEVYLIGTMANYIDEQNIEIKNAFKGSDAIRYVFTKTLMAVNGQVLPVGTALVSIFGGEFMPMTKDQFEKWVKPAIYGKIIASSEDFDQYVKENGLYPMRAQKKPSPVDVIELRGSLTVVTDEEAQFEGHGGDFLLRDPVSGNVWTQKAGYYNTNYEQLSYEEKN